MPHCRVNKRQLLEKQNGDLDAAAVPVPKQSRMKINCTSGRVHDDQKNKNKNEYLHVRLRLENIPRKVVTDTCVRFNEEGFVDGKAEAQRGCRVVGERERLDQAVFHVRLPSAVPERSAVFGALLPFKQNMIANRGEKPVLSSR